jgi:hypothetical protein
VPVKLMGQNEQTADRKSESGKFTSEQEVMETSDLLRTVILIRELAFRVGRGMTRKECYR